MIKHTHKKANGNVANGGGKWITPIRRRAIYLRDNLSCTYCGAGIEDGIIFTLDHLVPQELGGTNGSKNLVTCCKSCNSSKGSKTIRQFFAWLRDSGIDTSKIASRIRRNTARKLKGAFKI